MASASGKHPPLAAVKFAMKILRVLAAAAMLALAGCTTVSTRVLELNPAQKYSPTNQVDVFLQKPDRPHFEVAFLESRGQSEVEMLNDAREKARLLGADAIVKTQTHAEYYPPVAVYDPWYGPWGWGPRYRGWSPYYPYPWGYGGYYGVVGGYTTYVLKAVAIKYRDAPPAG
jgi:hypothetical protein